MPMLKLTENLRKILKKPLGELTSFDEITKKIKTINKIVICVGDKTCELALKNKIKVKICVYDSKISRKKIQIPDIVKNFKARKYYIKNPPGHLNLKSLDLISLGLEAKNNVKIIVDGEEDLIALAAIAAAPKDSIILYGQPNEGLVMIEVDDKIKAEAGNILEQMEETETN